jgi:hypothetical protein
MNFITSLIMMVQCWRRNDTGLHLCSPENIDVVRVALQRSPNKTTRRAEAQQGISR